TAPSSSNDVLDCGPCSRAAHATARVHHATGRCGSRTAARGARAAILGHTGGWMEIDLHGYDPRQIVETDMLAKIVQHLGNGRAIPAINSWSRPNARHLTRFRQHQHRIFWTSNSTCFET